MCPRRRLFEIRILEHCILMVSNRTFFKVGKASFCTIILLNNMKIRCFYEIEFAMLLFLYTLYKLYRFKQLIGLPKVQECRVPLYLILPTCCCAGSTVHLCYTNTFHSRLLGKLPNISIVCHPCINTSLFFIPFPSLVLTFDSDRTMGHTS